MGIIKCKYRVPGVTDIGIVLRRSKKGELLYEQDGGGIREAIINREGDAFYLFYDGWSAQDMPYKMCYNLRAKSNDLIHWEKQGINIEGARKVHPELSREVCSDYWCAVSPWILREDDTYYMYYISSENQAGDSTPLPPYITLLATSSSIEGPWQKANEKPGKHKQVCFPVRPGTFYNDTASAGHVMRNPKWQGEGDTENYKYMMFFSTAANVSGYLTRGIGIARTNDLTATDDYDKMEGNFWHIDENPLAPLEDDVENSSVYYEEANGIYFLFVNHIDPTNSYTDAVWVYWTQDTDSWDPENKAVVFDASNCTWAKGAIGMPTVLKLDDKTLVMMYDGVYGNGTGHLGRDIGMATISLPLSPQSFIKI